MGAVTYPNQKVIDFLKDKVVPLQLRSNAEPYATDFNIKWTPSLLVIDAEGKEHHRVTGFLSPVDLISWLILGIGKAAFDTGQFDQAIQCFDQVISEYPYTCAAPEAVFFRGVALYKSTHQPDNLKKAYQKLQEEYATSTWARRAYPYWQLP